MNQFVKAYKEYCEFAESEYVDYYTLNRWAARFNIDCFIIFYPDGFHYEINYDEGRISGPPCEIIIEAIEQIAEAVFSIVEESLEDADIFDELSMMKEYSKIRPEDPHDLEKLREELIKCGLESCQEMIDSIQDEEVFREKFLDMVMFISAYINVNEGSVHRKDTTEKADDLV